MPPLFTIITPCYNSVNTIRETLESVLNQTFDDFEYLIIDGVSTDGTLDIIKEYEGRFHGKMKYWSEKDEGIYDAMNKGIQKSSGRIIGIINSDDWYEKDALQNIANVFTGESYGIYYGLMRIVDKDNGKEIRCIINNHEYIRESMITHPTTFVTKKTYEDFGMFDCQYKKSADYDFIIRMVKQKKIKFVPIYKLQANFRTGGASESIDGLSETMRIKRKYHLMSNMQYIASMVYLKARKIFGYYTI